MASTLIRGRHVVCRVTGRTEADVVDDGAVFQRDGTIVEVGPYAALAAKHQADEMLGSPEHVILPGFVNSHHHVGLTPFQLGSPDHPLELWFASRLAARDVDPYLDTLYSAFEMVESGITTVQHLHGWRVAPIARYLTPRSASGTRAGMIRALKTIAETMALRGEPRSMTLSASRGPLPPCSVA